MTVTVSGILRDSGGNPSPNRIIKFYTQKGFNGALPSATLEVVTSETGSYNFELSVGIHLLSVQYNHTLTKVRKVTVTSDMPSPQTLDSLLAFEEPLLPDEIIIAQQLVSQAVSAANSASKDANQVAKDKSDIELIQTDVTQKAQQVSSDAGQVAQDKTEVESARQQVALDKVSSASSAQGASESATSAKLISGLDTVEQAVDLVAPEMVAQMVYQQSGGMNRYRQDSNGNWNMMVKVPMMTNKVFNTALGTKWLPEESPHPAFIRPNGTTMPWFEFGMYQASNDGRGNSVSAAYKDPYVSINYDTAKSKCSSMGSGWGLVSNAQWAAITLLCLANGYQPLGNTYYGYSHERSYLGGIRQDSGINGDASGSARILTGSGPVEFRHNKIMQGIADMAGNVWEWVDGLKTDGGQIFVATRERQDESDWTAQAAFLDDGLKLNSERTNTANTSVTWSSLGKSSTYVENQLLQQLMIEPIEETGATLGKLYYNNDGERLPFRGGNWYDTSLAGLAALSLSSERTHSRNYRGFRPAYFE